jgi:hypothetical protein
VPRIDLRITAVAVISAIVGAGIALLVDHGSAGTTTKTITVSESGATGSQETSITTPTGRTSKELVEELRCQGIPVGQVETYNEQTDPNHLLGRPNGYASKTNWTDTRIPDQTGDFEVDDGGSIEVYPNKADAKDRFDYVRGWAKSSPAWAGEYTYLLGSVVLRVSTTLVPSQASGYKKKAEEILANPNASASCKPPVTTTSPGNAKAPKPLSATASPYVAGGNPPLPEGAPGKVVVVATGDYNGSTIPIVARNNTSQVMTGIRVTGTATNQKGDLLATGADQGLYPNVVRPGEIAIGYVYFNDKRFASARFHLNAKGTPQAQDDLDWAADLDVTQAAHRGGSIVGYLKNNLKTNVSGPIQVYVLCFSSAGRLQSQYQNFTDQDTAAPGESIPFMVDLENMDSDTDACPIFLVAAGGHTG